MKLVLGISGASGAEIGLKFLAKVVCIEDIECFVVISEGAKNVLKHESHIQSLESTLKTNANRLESTLEILHEYKHRFRILDDLALHSNIASGSYQVDAMAIIPCSVNTLAKITYGLNDTLITRSALVCLKEHRKLLLAIREMPLHSIILQNMLTLSHLGVIISPPILGYYAKITTLESMEEFLIGKWLDSLGISHSLYHRWNPPSTKEIK